MGRGSHRICVICGKQEIRANHQIGSLFFSKFPLDENRCKQWVKAVGNEDLVHLPIEKLHQLRYVCGNHFIRGHFNKKMTRLKRSAVPTLQLSATPLTDEQLQDFPQHIATHIAVPIADTAMLPVDTQHLDSDPLSDSVSSTAIDNDHNYITAQAEVHMDNSQRTSGASPQTVTSDWIAVGREQRCDSDWMPSNSSRICSNHFKSEDKYTSKKGLTLLKKNAVPIIEPSTSSTTSQQKDTWKKRIAPLPEAKTIIANVYDFLQAEYENLKRYTGGSCDFSLLASIVKRTADATKVSEETVTAILEARRSEESTHEPVSRKRARVTHDEDEDVSNLEIVEHPIETLKVEIVESEQQHSEANHGILFQMQPLSTQQLSDIHQSLPSTAPTQVEVKQEPVDVEDHESTAAVYHLFHSNLKVTSEPTNHEYKDMEFSSTSTTQVGRRPD